MRGGVVHLRALPSLGVYGSLNAAREILRQVIHDVRDALPFVLRVEHVNLFAADEQHAPVAHLPARLGVKRSAVELDLVAHSVVGVDAARCSDLRVIHGNLIVPHEDRRVAL